MKIKENRYEKMIYRQIPNSGLKLPVLSLGMWINFGGINDYEKSKEMIIEAFNNGITHFDLANNYGPPSGSAEETLGRVLKEGLIEYRDELIISTKAGYGMWPGPYGDWGSRKYLISSLNQSLKRLGIDYVDIFYHHRFDPNTPLKETMLALRDIVLSGKALYIGLSNYNAEQTKEAIKLLNEFNVPFILNQPCYSMLNRYIEEDKLIDLSNNNFGIISFSALAQGKLSNKYINGIPDDSRAKNKYIEFLNEKDIDENLVNKLKELKKISDKRKQSISQLALAWVLRNTTSTLIGISRIEQLYENLETLNNLDFTKEELEEINKILNTTFQ